MVTDDGKYYCLLDASTERYMQSAAEICAFNLKSDNARFACKNTIAFGRYVQSAISVCRTMTTDVYTVACLIATKNQRLSELRAKQCVDTFSDDVSKQNCLEGFVGIK
jgi:hypothetical protein